MALELVHSSVSRHLLGGEGFGPVVMSREFPSALLAALEERSAIPESAFSQAGWNQLYYAIVEAGGKSWTTISRLCTCGTDYSGRGNRLAHHVVLEASDRRAAGPAAIARTLTMLRSPPDPPVFSSGVMVPTDLELEAILPQVPSDQVARILDAFQEGARPTIVTHARRGGELELIDAVIRQLPIKQRWLVQFALGPTNALRRGSKILCVLSSESELDRAVTAYPGATIVDLSRTPPPSPVRPVTIRHPVPSAPFAPACEAPAEVATTVASAPLGLVDPDGSGMPTAVTNPRTRVPAMQPIVATAPRRERPHSSGSHAFELESIPMRATPSKHQRVVRGTSAEPDEGYGLHALWLFITAAILVFVAVVILVLRWQSSERATEATPDEPVSTENPQSATETDNGESTTPSSSGEDGSNAGGDAKDKPTP